MLNFCLILYIQKKSPEVLLADFFATEEPADVSAWLNLDHENFDIASKSGEAVHLNMNSLYSFTKLLLMEIELPFQ